jgi:hypothetical protein
MTKGRVPLTLAAAIGDGQSRRLSAIFIPWVGRRPMIPPVGMTTLLQGQVFLESQRERVVVPHISRKTSGIWDPSFAREREPDCCGTEFVSGSYADSLAHPTANRSTRCSEVPPRTADLSVLAPGYTAVFPSASKIIVDIDGLQDGNSCSIAILHQLPPPIGTFGHPRRSEELHGGTSAERD